MKLKLAFLLISFLVPALASIDAGAGDWFIFRTRPRVVVQYRVVVPPVVEVVPEPAAVEVLEAARAEIQRLMQRIAELEQE